MLCLKLCFSFLGLYMNNLINPHISPFGELLLLIPLWHMKPLSGWHHSTCAWMNRNLPERNQSGEEVCNHVWRDEENSNELEFFPAMWKDNVCWCKKLLRVFVTNEGVERLALRESGTEVTATGPRAVVKSRDSDSLGDLGSVTSICAWPLASPIFSVPRFCLL